MRKLAKDIELEKRKLQQKKLNTNKSPEEKALIEFKLQLEKKKITPEGFFRLCDDTHSK